MTRSWKDKERLRNNWSQSENREKSQLNTVWVPEWDPGTKQNKTIIKER